MISLMRLGCSDDEARCCICFEKFTQEGLEPVSDSPGRWWDVCVGCAAWEKLDGAVY